MKPTNLRPSVKSLLLEAKGEIEKHAPLNLEEYEGVIVELRRKHHSYSEIADWLSERLGRPVNKGSVYRVYVDCSERVPEEIDPDDYEVVSNEEIYNKLLDEFAQHLVEVADAFEKERGCNGFAKSALEQASQLFRLRIADEKAAESADTRPPTPADAAKS